MSKNTYNILWADDDISAILDDDAKDLLMSCDINIVATATHAAGPGGVEELLQKYTAPGVTNDHIDAVITDANFNVLEDTLNSKGERDVSGLSFVLKLTKKYEPIPFFLFTARSEEMLLNKYDDGELDDFKKNKRWFAKGLGLMPLIDQIKRVVDENSSPEFKIRNLYKEEFNAARLIPGAEELLTKGLLLKDADSKGIELLFNETRQILEQIKYQLEKLEVIPQFKSLNNVSRFLSGQVTEEREYLQSYMPTAIIMPRALSRGLFYLTNIAQDGSHNMKDVNLEVISYTRDTKRLNLFYSILHILMEILCWFETVSKDPTGKQKCWEYSAIQKQNRTNQK